MSKELEQYLAPAGEIPWDSAAAFLVATKEATVEKVAADPQSARQAVAEARQKGLISGIRSSAASDVTHSARTYRTRGARVGEGLGTVGGALAGLAAGRKGGVAGKIGGTALGALIGRGTGKSIGEEIDRARTLKRYDKSKQKKKEAEIEKRSGIMRPEQPTARELIAGRGPKAKAARAALREKMRAECPVGKETDRELSKKIASARHLWKLAQGEAPTDAIEGASGANPSPGPVDIAGMSQEEAVAAGGVPAGPHVVPPSGAPTPEDVVRQEAEAQLEQEMQANQAAEQGAADHYKQVAEEAQGQIQESQMAAQEAQQAAEQASQQAQMSQQQADAATQQLQQQSQQDAAEKQQLNEEALGARQNIMQMRQAMTSYRENLQQLALQDPTAMAGPSPEEQGMEGEGPSPGQLQSMMADQQMGKEQQQAEQQQAQAQQQAAAQEQATPQDPTAQQATTQGAMGKQSSAIPELLVEKHAVDFTTRARGAIIGAAGGAMIQALSNRKGPRGISEKERVLKAKLQHLQRKPNKTVFDRHMVTMTRALSDTAKINRQHPGSAAAIAAVSGAIAGATVAPTISKMMGSF